MRFSSILGGLFGKKNEALASPPPADDSLPDPLTPADVMRQEKQREAASSHHGVLNAEFARMLEYADRDLKYPEAAESDPLAYLGNLEPLGLSMGERRIVSEWTRELIEEKGERAVWDSRLRLKLELRYLAAEPGLCRSMGRFPDEGSSND